MSRPARADVLACLASLRTWFDQERGAEEEEAREGVIRLATRDHGDVGDEVAGQADTREAGRVARALRAKFPALRITHEAVDEWVNLDIAGIAPSGEG